MEIKLKKRLWNNEAGETMNVTNERGNWAIGKGYAEEVKAAKPKQESKKQVKNETKSEKKS